MKQSGKKRGHLIAIIIAVCAAAGCLVWFFLFRNRRCCPPCLALQLMLLSLREFSACGEFSVHNLAPRKGDLVFCRGFRRIVYTNAQKKAGSSAMQGRRSSLTVMLAR